MKKKLNKIFCMLISLPKTIYFNIRCFDIRTALKLPILISYDTKFGEIYRGRIRLNNFENRRYRIKYGFGGSSHIPQNSKNYISIGKYSNIEFNGNARFAEGTILRCDYGTLKIGKNFCGGKNCVINCEYDITIGDDVLFGWDIYLRDTDGHAVLIDGDLSVPQKGVIIGNHVWVGSFVHILKGGEIGNDSVVAWRSCVLGKIGKDNVLIGGYPAKVLRENVEWNV